MPLHDLRCERGHTFEAFIPLSELDRPRMCDCGANANRVYLVAPMGRVEKIEYTSPSDGRAITTKYGRIEDLARNNCIEYDPEMKTDYMRRQQAEAQALEAKADALVEQQIHEMGSRKRERLEAELRGGADLAFERSTMEG